MSSYIEEFRKWYGRWEDAVKNIDSRWCDASCTDRLDDIKIKLTDKEKEELRQLGYKIQ